MRTHSSGKRIYFANVCIRRHLSFNNSVNMAVRIKKLSRTHIILYI